MGTRWQTDLVSQTTSRKAESNLPLSLAAHFTSTRRSVDLVSLIPPIVTPDFSGFTRLLRFFRIATQQHTLSEGFISVASERARFGHSSFLGSGLGFFFFRRSFLAGTSLSRLRGSGVDRRGGRLVDNHEILLFRRPCFAYPRDNPISQAVLEEIDDTVLALHVLSKILQPEDRLLDAVPNGEEHVFLGLAETLHFLQDLFQLLQPTHVILMSAVQVLPDSSNLRSRDLGLLCHIKIPSKHLLAHTFI